MVSKRCKVDRKKYNTRYYLRLRRIIPICLRVYYLIPPFFISNKFLYLLKHNRFGYFEVNMNKELQLADSSFQVIPHINESNV